MKAEILNLSDGIEAARYYLKQGFKVHPILRQGNHKSPIHKNWPTRDAKLQDFEADHNIGLRLGEEFTKGQFIVDVDLDMKCDDTVHQIDVACLIAYQIGPEAHGLFCSSKTALSDTQSEAVGTGQSVAKRILKRLQSPFMSHEAALRLAAYAVYQAKEIDPYCGKRTHLALLSGCKAQVVDPWIVETWESQFAGIERVEIGRLRNSLGIGPMLIETKHSGAHPEFHPSKVEPVRPQVSPTSEGESASLPSQLDNLP